MQTFTIKLNSDQIKVIGEALSEYPFKFSAPVIQDLQTQINNQTEGKDEKSTVRRKTAEKA